MELEIATENCLICSISYTAYSLYYIGYIGRSFEDAKFNFWFCVGDFFDDFSAEWNHLLKQLFSAFVFFSVRPVPFSVVVLVFFLRHVEFLFFLFSNVEQVLGTLPYPIWLQFRSSIQRLRKYKIKVSLLLLFLNFFRWKWLIYLGFIGVKEGMKRGEILMALMSRRQMQSLWEIIVNPFWSYQGVIKLGVWLNNIKTTWRLIYNKCGNTFICKDCPTNMSLMLHFVKSHKWKLF